MLKANHTTHNMAGSSRYIESKPRFEILDGLRGVAAFGVIMFHVMECYPPEVASKVFFHGFMAVDFFFALSGFVLGYAYDDRWDRMSVKDFFKRRITRLHPMVIFGALVGLCFFYYSGGSPAFGKIDAAPWYMLIFQALLMICMIPLPSSMDIRGWGELTSIDGPVWTLMYEYVANILYAVFFRHIGKVLLGVVMAFCAVGTADLCFNLNIFGLLTDPAYSYSVNGGFVLNAEHVYRALVRLLFPFTAGLLLSRTGRSIRIRHGFLISSLMVLAMLSVPFLGGRWAAGDGLYQFLCIALLFPVILAIGSGSELKGRKATSFCIFLGKISFPLYITHYPLMYMHMSWAQCHMDAPVGTHVFVGVATLSMAVFIAWAALKLYDEPVRGWLKEHWLK